jgi:predicted component of type VI protein secretion system
MYSRAKMEVDFLFCTNLLDFSPEKVCDLGDFSPEKVLKSVENTFMLK